MTAQATMINANGTAEVVEITPSLNSELWKRGFYLDHRYNDNVVYVRRIRPYQTNIGHRSMTHRRGGKSA